mgnify:CR=1 FL=1
MTMAEPLYIAVLSQVTGQRLVGILPVVVGACGEDQGDGVGAGDLGRVLLAERLVERHRKAGDTLMIITATNAFVTAPIARRLGIDELIATEPEMDGERYTGRVSGTPSFREGKVERLQQWLDEHDAVLDGATFYSDSHNDIALLREVDHDAQRFER